MCIKAGVDGFKKISEVSPQTSPDIAFGPLSEMLRNHCPKVIYKTQHLWLLLGWIATRSIKFGLLCLLFTSVSLAKQYEPIEIPFGV